ncbi:MAG TPA: hypothetical protein VL443_20550 [Cyclobacteriaceae bacterium]|jgi:hypothetical protein|nr:hypothetical protein [Cyclobacteriaceae bacterium]
MERILITRIFKKDKNELLYNSKLPKLLSGKTTCNNEGTKFFPVSSAPSTIATKFPPTVCESISQYLFHSNYQTTVIEHNFERYFLSCLEHLFQGRHGQREDYRDYQDIYAAKDYLSEKKVIELSMLHALLVLVERYSNDINKLRFIYDHLCENSYGIPIPTTTFESFRKYLRRKRNRLPDAIIHGLYNQPSNNHEITELMKNVLILLDINILTHKSAYSVKEDLDHIIETMPNAKVYGIYSLSRSKIASFLKEPKANNLRNYAKSNPLEFRRKVTGMLAFLRASAPLVKIYVDAYVFQVEYKNAVTKKPDRIVGVMILDDFSDYVIAEDIGDSENYDVLMTAFERYFKRTKNAISREIVVDKFTYRILRKNKALMNLFRRYGLEEGRGITISSNPNRKSRLELFFNIYQQKMMGSMIIYIGPSLRAKRNHSHPFKEFIIHLRKNLPEKFDVVLELRKLIKIHYNKDYISPTQENLSTPENRFDTYDWNPLATVTKEVVNTLFTEHHSVTIRAGAAVLKQDGQLLIFYKRDFDFINNFNGVEVDAYLSSKLIELFIYRKDSFDVIATVPLFKIVPSALFDRTEEDKAWVANFNKETANLLSLFEKELSLMEATVISAVKGRDIQKYTKLAQMKKEMSIEQDIAGEMNLTTQKEEPVLFHANKSRRKTKSRNILTQHGIDIIDTF